MSVSAHTLFLQRALFCEHPALIPLMDDIGMFIAHEDR
jgi:hypothetical protein